MYMNMYFYYSPDNIFPMDFFRESGRKVEGENET